MDGREACQLCVWYGHGQAPHTAAHAVSLIAITGGNCETNRLAGRRTTGRTPGNGEPHSQAPSLLQEGIMGRSVSVPNGAINVCFAQVDIVESFEWDDLVEDYKCALSEAFASMVPVSGNGSWLGREDRVVGGNSFVKFGISEYCGLVSLWMVRHHGGNFANRWIEKAGPKFAGAVESVFGARLERVATFSNGESVYRRV